MIYGKIFTRRCTVLTQHAGAVVAHVINAMSAAGQHEDVRRSRCRRFLLFYLLRHLT